MKAIAAKEAKNNFGAMLDSVQREPIAIEKHGRAVAVVMSVEDYRQMNTSTDSGQSWPWARPRQTEVSSQQKQ